MLSALSALPRSLRSLNFILFSLRKWLFLYCHEIFRGVEIRRSGVLRLAASARCSDSTAHCRGCVVEDYALACRNSRCGAYRYRSERVVLCGAFRYRCRVRYSADALQTESDAAARHLDRFDYAGFCRCACTVRCPRTRIYLFYFAQEESVSAQLRMALLCAARRLHA